jgi:hypothetical protein
MLTAIRSVKDEYPDRGDWVSYASYAVEWAIGLWRGLDRCVLGVRSCFRVPSKGSTLWLASSSRWTILV